MTSVQAGASRMSNDAVFVEIANATVDSENKDKALQRGEVKANAQRAKGEREKLKVLQQEAAEQKADAENSGGFFNFLGRAILGVLTGGSSLVIEATICAAEGKKFDMTSGGVFGTLGQVFGAIATVGGSFIAKNVVQSHENAELAEDEAAVESSKLEIEKMRKQMQQGLDSVKLSDERAGSMQNAALEGLDNSLELNRRISKRYADRD
jgi:hypothetical protein